jgi:periplasmic protein TonB
MFESVAPETFYPRSRKVFYESLPVSILVHALAIGVYMAAGLWQVTFPNHTPKMLALYTLAAEPTPPPPPPPPAAPRKVVAQVQPVPVMPIEDLAPTIIPEEVPLVLPSASLADIGPTPAGIVGGVAGGIEGGVVGGVVDGSSDGVVGGTVGSIAVADVAPPDTVIIKRDQPLPMRAMSQVYPRYPEEARIRGQQDMLLVRYIIGKNGKVREVIVLQKPEREIFEKTTVKAIRQWRFKPFIKDGVPQEVIHELTVFFKLNA